MVGHLGQLGILAVLWRMFADLSLGWTLVAAVSTSLILISLAPGAKSAFTRNRAVKAGLPGECRRIAREIRSTIESSRVVSPHPGELVDDGDDRNMDAWYAANRDRQQRENQLLGQIRLQHETALAEVARRLTDLGVITEDDVRSFFWRLDTGAFIDQCPQTLADWATRAETFKAA